MRSLLKQVKQSGKNLPSLLLWITSHLVGEHRNSLGEDYYLVLEDLFYASMDSECYSLSDKALATLYKRFGRTDKILKMQADFCEGRGYDTKAIELHSELLKDNLLDTSAMKKQIGLVRTQGQLNKSVSMLNTFLGKHPQDEEAWLQLADCYMEVAAFYKAQHCYAQLVMMDPSNLNYVLMLAETSHTVGGQENLVTAKSYYSYILMQDSSHLRAIFGLLSLLEKGKEDNAGLASELRRHVVELYRKKKQERVVAHLT